MNFLNRCAGIRPGSPALAAEVQQRLKEVLPVARELFRAEHPEATGKTEGGYHFGSRFSEDHAALERVRAARPTTDEVLNDPVGWALDALRDAASTDYFFLYEKEY